MNLKRSLVFEIKPRYLQQDIIGERINKAYKKLRSEISCTDSCLILLTGFARSPY